MAGLWLKVDCAAAAVVGGGLGIDVHTGLTCQIIIWLLLLLILLMIRYILLSHLSRGRWVVELALVWIGNTVAVVTAAGAAGRHIQSIGARHISVEILALTDGLLIGKTLLFDLVGGERL